MQLKDVAQAFWCILKSEHLADKNLKCSAEIVNGMQNAYLASDTSRCDATSEYTLKQNQL